VDVLRRVYVREVRPLAPAPVYDVEINGASQEVSAVVDHANVHPYVIEWWHDFSPIEFVRAVCWRPCLARISPVRPIGMCRVR